MATSGFHLWQFQVFNSGAEGLVVVLFWLDLWEIFFLATLGFEPVDLWISSPALYHCAMATSGFHLWQFQVFNSGAEGLVVVLFWLDLWEIFFLATLGFELGTSGSLVLHSTSVPLATSGFHLWQFQVFNSGAEGLVVVLFWLDLWEIFFLATLGFELGTFWISSPALYHCAMATSGFHLWQFQVFNSGAEGLVVVLFWLDLWEIFFLATLGFELGTSGSLVLHSTTVPWQLLVFTSDNFRYLTLVQRDWWWYCLIGPVRDFLFGHTGFELGTSGSLVLHSTTVPWQLLVFTSNSFRYLPLVQRDLVVLFWLDLWEIFFLATLGFELWDLWISSPALYHHVPWQLLVFTSDSFRYLTLVQRDWWWYCSDWTCERFSFWPHWGLNQGPLDL